MATSVNSKPNIFMDKNAKIIVVFAGENAPSLKLLINSTPANGNLSSADKKNCNFTNSKA